MNNLETVPLTPDGSVQWNKSNHLAISRRGMPWRGVLYQAPNVSEESLALLRRRPRNAERIYDTTGSKVYRCGNLALKVVLGDLNSERERWERVSGRLALSINVALEAGLDETSVLDNGYQVTTPEYQAALFFPELRAARWVMSFADGETGNRTNQHLMGEKEERRQVCNTALERMGVNPSAAWLDDHPGNLILQRDERRIVLIDNMAMNNNLALPGAGNTTASY